MNSFEERYSVLDKIGEGSFSEVLKCEHRTSANFFAAKRLKKAYKTEASVKTCAEVIAAQKVPFHPNILNMLEYHYDNLTGHVTFVFELMDMSMYEYLKTRKRGISERKGQEYLYQILLGLEHLHRSGLFHRDVKPENILIKYPSLRESPLFRTSRREVIKLADLGSVRGIYSLPPYTEYISTRWYRSPECLLTIGNYGPKMDVWATGCVYYEMLTLMPLFPGNNEIDQLCKIHQVLGSPSIQFLSKLKSKSRNCIFFPKLRGTGLGVLLPHVTRLCRIIMQYMVEYDPDKRTNVRRLLRNNYFDEVRERIEASENSRLQAKSHIWYKEGMKRSIGDYNGGLHSNNGSYVKNKIPKCDYGSSKGSSKSGGSSKFSITSSAKSATPSIEIPYYSTHSTPVKSKFDNKYYHAKITHIPTVDYKLGQCNKHQGPKIISDSQLRLSKRNTAKKSVEIIMSDLQKAEMRSIMPPQKCSHFHSKSMFLPRGSPSPQPTDTSAKEHKHKRTCNAHPLRTNKLKV